MHSDNSGGLPPSQRRLQRPPDFTGPRLVRFRQVALRHGLPGAVLGAVCLGVPDMRALLATGLDGVIIDPGRYLYGAAYIFGALIAYVVLLDRRLDAAAIGWMGYLLAVSAWEEWVFRLAVPYFAEARGFELHEVVIASNLAFGLMHYFTLRWRWQWCVAACLGGLALSRMMNEHFDLALVIAAHWIGTFVNTPRPPGRSGTGRGTSIKKGA